MAEINNSWEIEKLARTTIAEYVKSSMQRAKTRLWREQHGQGCGCSCCLDQAKVELHEATDRLDWIHNQGRFGVRALVVVKQEQPEESPDKR